ncbi:MAG: inner membrane protein YpjD [Granulosicoccus sp.]
MNLILSLFAALLYGSTTALLLRSLTSVNKAGASAANTMGDVTVPEANTYSANDSTATNPAQNAVQAGGNEEKRLGFYLASLAVVIHLWVVINQTGFPHSLSLPLFTSLAATTLTIALLHLVLCLKQPADYLGIAVYPLAAASLIAALASGGGEQIVGDAVQIHVFLSLLSYAVLALAAAQAILVAIQRRFLSRHKPGGFIRSLPALDRTEQLLFTLLRAGFWLLSLSLATGFFYLENMFIQHLVHKTVLSCVAWCIFGVLLFGRWKFGWRGKIAVRWTLVGFGMLILAYFGSKLVLEILLS